MDEDFTIEYALLEGEFGTAEVSKRRVPELVWPAKRLGIARYPRYEAHPAEKTGWRVWRNHGDHRNEGLTFLCDRLPFGEAVECLRQAMKETE